MKLFFALLLLTNSLNAADEPVICPAVYNFSQSTDKIKVEFRLENGKLTLSWYRKLEGEFKNPQTWVFDKNTNLFAVDKYTCQVRESFVSTALQNTPDLKIIETIKAACDERYPSFEKIWEIITKEMKINRSMEACVRRFARETKQDIDDMFEAASESEKHLRKKAPATTGAPQ